MKQQMSNFLTYRAEHFECVINSAKEIVNILDVDPVFLKQKKIQFDQEANDEQINNPKIIKKKKIKAANIFLHVMPMKALSMQTFTLETFKHAEQTVSS
jgi:hypothetical protein